VIPIAMMGGVFISATYENVKNYNKYIAVLVILILLYGSWIYAVEKIDTMKAVKSFIPGFFEGCKWVDKNTPEDSILVSVYGHQTAYQCNRVVFYGTDGPEIFLTNNDTAYQHLKLHGADYIFVIEGLISTANLSENYPLSFVQYLESNTTAYELVYDNREQYGQAGVRVYQVI